MSEQVQGCARVTSTVQAPESSTAAGESPSKEVIEMAVRVGQKAPEFTAPAYYKGAFTSVKLSDFAGKWVLLCFYPGDFTFV